MKRIASVIAVLCLSLFPLSSIAQEIGVGAQKPSAAHWLFDGSKKMLDANWEYWEGPRLEAEPPIKWQVVNDPAGPGTAVNTNDPAAANGKYGAADIVTKQKYRDFRLHIEFLIQNEGGNSGVYLQNRYEIQVLDGDSTTHGMAAIINEKAAPYKMYNGLGKWNAYDIVFRAARFDQNGNLIEKALMTMYFNGKKVHGDEYIQQVWGGPFSGLDGGNNGGKGITDRPGGIKLQAEGHDVLYRNIWIVPMEIPQSSTDF
ncbi:DUF1080 domain-containing protein [Echinicola strongylocentroti]|uniref:DUF1080 domain-containing protein n=1 Tax=Echinicola strongylocentroti TaxID=1795355 RepID=A0A2Z4IEB6_9BACT|nr:DUF1080 domain-containing protein [Echinicola strongylocentroti]AWW28818.1 DUF1080 domain-containing protein [Echinicola strongylocentroti]